jgi:hypothetical protein
MKRAGWTACPTPTSRHARHASAPRCSRSPTNWANRRSPRGSFDRSPSRRCATARRRPCRRHADDSRPAGSDVAMGRPARGGHRRGRAFLRQRLTSLVAMDPAVHDDARGLRGGRGQIQRAARSRSPWMCSRRRLVRGTGYTPFVCLRARMDWWPRRTVRANVTETPELLDQIGAELDACLAATREAKVEHARLSAALRALDGLDAAEPVRR